MREEKSGKLNWGHSERFPILPMVRFYFWNKDPRSFSSSCVIFKFYVLKTY